MSRMVSIRMPERIYDVLNTERRNFSMSSFINDLLGAYVDVVESENAETCETVN
jgi:hypothetical protein